MAIEAATSEDGLSVHNLRSDYSDRLKGSDEQMQDLLRDILDELRAIRRGQELALEQELK